MSSRPGRGPERTSSHVTTASSSGRLHIVAPERLTGEGDVLVEQCSVEQIQALDDWSVLSFLAERHLIANSQQCRACSAPCNLENSRSSGDFIWQCGNMEQCRERTHLNVRHGSIFDDESAKLLTLRNCVRSIFFWLVSMALGPVLRKLSDSKPPLYNLQAWLQRIRGLVAQQLRSHPSQLGGVHRFDLEHSITVYVQLEPASEDGRRRLFLVEEVTAICVLCVVKDDAELQTKIALHVTAGSKVVSKGLPPGVFDEEKCINQIAIEEKNSDGTDDAKELESTISRVKREVEDLQALNNYPRSPLMEMFMDEYTFRQSFPAKSDYRDNHFVLLCRIIQEQFPFASESRSCVPAVPAPSAPTPEMAAVAWQGMAAAAAPEPGMASVTGQGTVAAVGPEMMAVARADPAVAALPPQGRGPPAGFSTSKPVTRKRKLFDWKK